MHFDQLEYFVAAAEDLSFRRAANRLHLAQPTLSYAVARLEDRLQVRLFERGRAGVRLTPAGKALLEGSRTLLAEANELVSVVREVGEVGKPRLRLGVSRVAQRFSLPELLRAFEHESGVSVVQYELTTREQLEGLRAGALDVGVFTLPAPGAQGLELHVVVEAPNGVWLAATHPLANRAVISLIDLAELPYLLITREANPDFDEAQLNCCRRAGFEPVAISRSRRSLSGASAAKVIAAGECWTIEPEVVAADWPGTVWRPCTPPADPFRLALAWPRGPASRRITELVDYLTRQPLRVLPR